MDICKSGYTAYIELVSCKEKVSLAPWTVDVTPHEIRETYYSQLTTTMIFLFVAHAQYLLFQNLLYSYFHGFTVACQ